MKLNFKTFSFLCKPPVHSSARYLKVSVDQNMSLVDFYLVIKYVDRTKLDFAKTNKQKQS